MVGSALAVLSRSLRKGDDPAMARADPAADAGDVAACLQGDADAYRRLVERYQNRAAALMSRFTRDAGELEELVQDVFVAAWKSLRGFDQARPFYPWLRTVAIHVGYRYWKNRKRAVGAISLEETGELAAAPDTLPPERAEEILHALLARLPPRDRLVLTFIYLEGHSVAEVADLTGWSKTMVKVQAYRARGKLKRMVGEHRAKVSRRHG
jgi:RNA polymerase sigma-70 factor (ECF subfamily)